MEEPRYVIGDNLVDQVRVLSLEESVAMQLQINQDEWRQRLNHQNDTIVGDELDPQILQYSSEEYDALYRRAHDDDDDERPCCCCIDAMNIFCCIRYLFRIFHPQSMEEDLSPEQSELLELESVAGQRVLTEVEWRRIHDLRYMLFGDNSSSEEDEQQRVLRHQRDLRHAIFGSNPPSEEEEEEEEEPGDALAPEDEAERQLEAREFERQRQPRPYSAMFRELAVYVSELTAEFREPAPEEEEEPSQKTHAHSTKQRS